MTAVNGKIWFNKEAAVKKRAYEILDMLIDELSDQSIEDYSKSAGFQNVIRSLLRPQLSHENFISLTELARKENRDNPGYVIQSWLRSRNTIEFLRLWEKENNPDFNEAECNQVFEKLKKPSYTLTVKKGSRKLMRKGLFLSKETMAVQWHILILLSIQLWLYPEKRYKMVKIVSGELKTIQGEKDTYVTREKWV